jgi:hypothetical protein
MRGYANFTTPIQPQQQKNPYKILNSLFYVLLSNLSLKTIHIFNKEKKEKQVHKNNRKHNIQHRHA